METKQQWSKLFGKDKKIISSRAVYSSRMMKCHDILKETMKSEVFIIKSEYGVSGTRWFTDPVDPVELEIPDYFEVIKTPMDLLTVKKNLDEGVYDGPEKFLEHVRLVFSNAVMYNTDPQHPVHIVAKRLSEQFEEQVRDMNIYADEIVSSVLPNVVRSDTPYVGCRATKEALLNDKKTPLGIADDCPICLVRGVACEVGCHPITTATDQDDVVLIVDDAIPKLPACPAPLEDSKRQWSNLFGKKPQPYSKDDVLLISDDAITGRAVIPKPFACPAPLEESKKQWSNLFGKKTKVSSLREEIDLTLDKSDVVAERFRESLQKRKIDLTTTSEVENVNPFFAKKERVERKLDLGITKDGNSISGNQREVNFPSMQHVGISLPVECAGKCANLVATRRTPPSMDALYEPYLKSVFTCVPREEKGPTLDFQFSREFLKDSMVRRPALLSAMVNPHEQSGSILSNSVFFSSSTLLSSWLYYSDVSDYSERKHSTEKQADTDTHNTMINDAVVAATVEEWLISWSARRAAKNQRKKRKVSKWDDSYWDDSDDEGCDVSNLLALIGPGGCGKTSVVYSVARKIGINVLEISACQSRSGTVVKKMIMEATQSHGVNKQYQNSATCDDSALGWNLVLFDEADIVFEEDVSFYTAVLQIAKSSRCPIILTSEEDIPLGSNLQIRKIIMDRLPLAHTIDYLAKVASHSLSKDSVVSLALCSGNNIKASQSVLQLPSTTIRPPKKHSSCTEFSSRTLTETSFLSHLRKNRLDVSIFDTLEHFLSTPEEFSVPKQPKIFLMPKSLIIFDIFPRHISLCSGSFVKSPYIQVIGSSFIATSQDDVEYYVSVYLGGQKCSTKVISESLLYFKLPNKVPCFGIHNVVIKVTRKAYSFHGKSILTSSNKTDLQRSWLHIEQDMKTSLWKPLPSNTAVATKLTSTRLHKRTTVVSDDDSDDDDFIDTAPKSLLKSSRLRVVEDDVNDSAPGDSESLTNLDKVIENQYHNVLIEVIRLLSSYDCCFKLFSVSNPKVATFESIPSELNCGLNLCIISDSIVDGLYGNCWSDNRVQIFIGDMRSIFKRYLELFTSGDLYGIYFLSNVFELVVENLFADLNISSYIFEPQYILSIVDPTLFDIDLGSINATNQEAHILVCDDFSDLMSLSNFFVVLSESDTILSREFEGIEDFIRDDTVFRHQCDAENESCYESNVANSTIQRYKENFHDVIQAADYSCTISTTLLQVAEYLLHNMTECKSKLIGLLPTTQVLEQVSGVHSSDYAQLLLELRRCLNAGIICKYMFMLYRRALLYCLLRNGLFSMKYDELLKLSKKRLVGSQAARLSSLGQEVSLDYLPYMLLLLQYDKSSSSNFLDLNIRQRRDTRRSLATSMQSQFQYCTKAFPNLSDSYFDLLLEISTVCL